MRKQKVLFLCTQNSARSQMAEALLRHHAGDRFEAYSAGCNPGDEIHPYAVEAMEEIGIDLSDQHPKGLRTYSAGAEKDCPKTFPGVGTRLVWVFDDPRGEDVREEEMLDKFREIRDEIEQKMLDWLEHPEEELAKLKADRKREREERLRAARQARELRTELEEVPEHTRWPHPAAPRAVLPARS
jgi:arsenate reductase (thioredoxin)